MPAVTLDAGAVHYEETGPADGPVLVFVHGFTMAASLWRPLTERLADQGIRCIAPTWPLGAHPEPMRPGADVTLGGVAAMIGSFLDELDLHDVVLVGNDTGGAICQIVACTGAVAGISPDRLAALVLTGCDAFEHFPPPILKPFIAASRSSLLFRTALKPLGTKFGRHKGYADLAHADIDELVKEWVRPSLSNPAIAEDLRQFTASMQQSVTLGAAAKLNQFTKPALIAWSADDLFFGVDDGHRLAEALPNARFELIENARTFSMIDQPDALAAVIGDFVRTLPVSAAQASQAVA